MKIEIYGFDPSVFKCKPCINAKRLCEARGWEYSFTSVSDELDKHGKPIMNAQVGKELAERLGRENLFGVTMPRVFVDGKLVGGFDDFRAISHTLQ